MDVLFWMAILTAAAALVGFAFKFAKPQGAGDEANREDWEDFAAVAAEVGGLRVVRTDRGAPRLTGLVDGVEVVIDRENHISRGLDGMLGLRCMLTDADDAPNAALWIGDIEALRTQYGRPRPAGDGHGLFEVYTRVEPSASDWWQEPRLHEALTQLEGAGLVLYEGQLTVLFARLDAESVRAAIHIPGLVRQGVHRVTLH